MYIRVDLDDYLTSYASLTNMFRMSPIELTFYFSEVADVFNFEGLATLNLWQKRRLKKWNSISSGRKRSTTCLGTLQIPLADRSTPVGYRQICHNVHPPSLPGWAMPFSSRSEILPGLTSLFKITAFSALSCSCDSIEIILHFLAILFENHTNPLVFKELVRV